MAYHTITDVQDETGQTYHATDTIPNITKVNDIIANTDATVDGYVKGRYQIPVVVGVSPTAVKVLKQIALKLTIGEIETITKQTTRCDTTEGGGAPINAKKAEAFRLLRDIEKGVLSLTDAVAGYSTGEVRFGTGNDDTENPPEPQW
jgi:phage gp36-like protein